MGEQNEKDVSSRSKGSESQVWSLTFNRMPPSGLKLFPPFLPNSYLIICLLVFPIELWAP